MESRLTTRFPPSPTGLLQAGNVRTAIFNYLFARQTGGTFILRIEDTDRRRSKKEFEDNIIEVMRWLGLAYDSFYRQSENSKRHKEVLLTFIEKDLAYVSKEEPKEEGQRGEVIRFRNPNEEVTFVDTIRGEITMDTTELGDFVIAKSMDEPLYHLGVVVDDFDEGVTHVIRGEDHISNTPRQILILRALGGELPMYTHLPLLLGADRKKLSKRSGAKAVSQYREEGFIAEGMINYLALLGWHPENEDEIFTLEELIERFDITRIQKGAAIFDETKLRWFNHQHLKRLRPDDYGNRLRLFAGSRSESVPEYLDQIIGLLQERAETLGDAVHLLKEGEFSFMEDYFQIDSAGGGSSSGGKELLIKGSKTNEVEVRQNLENLQQILMGVPNEQWGIESVRSAAMILAEKQGKAQVLWPLRVALSGREKSPDPFTIAALIGKDKTLGRIQKAILGS